MIERVVTQEEAARLAGCSKDTIARARKSGRFPNARLRDGRWAIPTGDLLAAGLYAPADDQLAGDHPAPVHGDRSGDTVLAESLRVELAQALARVAALEDLVARQDEQLAFLRRLTVDTLGARGSS